jgi:hypothetical protein
MGTFAETALVDYCLSFADQGKQILFSVSVGSKQTEERHFCFLYMYVSIRIYIYILYIVYIYTVGANRSERRRRKVSFLKIAISLVSEQILMSRFFKKLPHSYGYTHRKF